MRVRRTIPDELTTANRQSSWLFILPGLLLVGLLGLPLFALFLRAFGVDFFKIAFSETAVTALKLSLFTSLVSVSISLLIGTPLAYVLARWEFRGKAAIQILIDLPIVLPPSVAGLALLIAFGRNGVFGATLASIGISLPFTTVAVIIAQTFVSAPLYVRSATIGFAAIDPQIEEAAHVEGANQWQLFSQVMFPLARRALASGTVVTYTRALGEFGATILFAGNLEGISQTMPLAIYLGFERNLNVAIVLSVMLVMVSMLMMTLIRKLDGDKIY